MSKAHSVTWQLGQVKSPHLDDPVDAIIARNIPYVANANRLQNLNIYLPKTAHTTGLVNKPVAALPKFGTRDTLPQWHVHIHGGAWRDPQLSSTSVEAAVAHAFSDPEHPITAVASINYTLTHFPTHATLPYDIAAANHADPAREAVHPMHIHDVLRGLALLRELGLTDDSYVLSGHSCGACLAFQATLAGPAHWGFDDVSAPPRPAALIGMNGLYDLPDLVHDLGASHGWLSDEYKLLTSNAFGNDESEWPAASPARFDIKELARGVQEGRTPRLIVIDQSSEDQLVSMGQAEKLEAHLKQMSDLRVVRGTRCTGEHAAPWKEGEMIWQGVRDALKLVEDLS